MGLAFFGLTSNTAPQFRVSVFKQIHEIVFHGNGGYDWNTIYNMPIWLRKYTFNEIKKFYDEKAKAEEKAFKGKNTKNLIDSDGKVNPKNFANLPKQPKRKSSYK